MKAAVHVMKSRVVQNDKNRVGVTLFGTKKTSDIDVSFRQKDHTRLTFYCCMVAHMPSRFQHLGKFAQR